jgi:hypothetical protein
MNKWSITLGQTCGGASDFFLAHNPRCFVMKKNTTTSYTNSDRARFNFALKGIARIMDFARALNPHYD